MNPWMLHEVRKDDVAARYQEAEQSRLAALASEDSPRAATGHSRFRQIAALRRATGKRATRLAAGIAVVASLLVIALAAFA